MSKAAIRSVIAKILNKDFSFIKASLRVPPDKRQSIIDIIY
jgi:hypothetical protein